MEGITSFTIADEELLNYAKENIGKHSKAVNDLLSRLIMTLSNEKEECSFDATSIMKEAEKIFYQRFLSTLRSLGVDAFAAFPVHNGRIKKVSVQSKHGKAETIKSRIITNAINKYSHIIWNTLERDELCFLKQVGSCSLSTGLYINKDVYSCLLIGVDSICINVCQKLIDTYDLARRCSQLKRKDWYGD